MLKFLKQLKEENQKHDFKTAQRAALGRLAPRLQWAHLWGDEQISEEDEKYIESILIKSNPSELEETLSYLSEFMNSKNWNSGESNYFSALKNEKNTKLIRIQFKELVLKKLDEKISNDEKNQIFGLTIAATTATSEAIREKLYRDNTTPRI